MMGLTIAGAIGPDWGPLALYVPPSEREDFMWMHRDGGVHFYRHVVTRRYLMIDAQGNCLRWDRWGLQVVDFGSEYLRVTDME